jgi:hypothetical protein
LFEVQQNLRAQLLLVRQLAVLAGDLLRQFGQVLRQSRCFLFDDAKQLVRVLTEQVQIRLLASMQLLFRQVHRDPRLYLLHRLQKQLPLNAHFFFLSGPRHLLLLETCFLVLDRLLHFGKFPAHLVQLCQQVCGVFASKQVQQGLHLLGLGLQVVSLRSQFLPFAAFLVNIFA